MKVEIRKATKDDCMDLAKLVTIVWNETYKGIVDESFLQRLYKNERARGIESTKKFNNKERHKYVLLVNDELSGFINVGKCDKTGFPGYGEVYALYILKKYQAKDSRIKILEQSHKKQGAARNLGIQNAKGVYIGFVESFDTRQKVT